MLNFILYIFIFQIFVLIQISISQEPNSDKEFSVEKSFLENEDDIPDDLVEKILLDELYVNLENPSVSSNITPESLEDLSTHMESINSGPENTLRVSEDNSNIRNNISTSNSNTTTSQNRNFDLQNTSNDSKNIEMFLGNANMCVRSINFYIKSSIDILKHTYQCLYNESPVLRSECLNLQPNDNTLQDKMSALQNSISELQNTTSELQCIMKNLHKSTSESQSRICKLQNTSYLKCTNSESTNSSFNLINTNLDLRHTAPNLENNALGLNYASSSLQNNASNSQREFHSIHNNSILQQNTLSSVNNTHNLGNTTSNSQYISSLMRNDTSRMENIFPNSSSTSNLQNTTLNLQYPIYESLNSVINAQDTSCYLQNLTSNIQQTFQSDYSSNFQTHFGIGNTWFNMQNHTSNLQNEPFNLQYDTCNLQHNAYNSQNTTGIRCASHKLEDIVSMLQHILSNLQRITPYTQNISAQTINNTHNLQETNPIVQDNISNLEEITPNVDDCNDNLEEIAPNVDDSDDNLEEITANVDDSDDNLEDTSQTSRNNNSNSQKNVTTRVRRRTSRLNRTSLRLRRNTSNSQNTVPRLRSNSSNLQNESCNLQNESSNLQNESSNLQNESSNLQNESSNLQNESSNLQNESSNLQNKSSNLQNESSNLQNESSNLQSESSNLQSESSNLQSESSNLQSESSDLQYSMSYLQDVCAKLFSITHNLKCMDIEIYDVHTFLDNKIVNYLNKKFAVDNETDGNSNLDDDDNSIKPYRKRPCKSKDTEKSNMDKSKSSSFSSFKDIHMERLPIRNFTLFCSKEVFKMDYRTIIPIANSLNNIHLTLEENKTKLIKDYNLKIEELKNFIIKISKNVDRSILNKLKFRNDILSLSPDKILEEVLQKIKYNRNLVKCSVPDEFYIRMKIKMFLPKLNSVSASIRSFKTLETKVKQLIKTNVFSMLTHGILLLLPNDKSKTFIKLFNNLDNLLDTSEKSFMEGKYFLNEQLIKKHRILIFSANKSLGRLYRLLKSLLMNLEFFNLSYNDNGKIFTTIFHFLYNTNKKNEDEFNHTTNELYEKHLKNDILSILSYEKKYILECHARANNHFNMNDDEINESSKWLQSLLDDEKNARNAMEIYSKIIKAAKYEHIFFLMRILSKLQISLKLLYNSTNMKSLRSSYAAISKKRLDRIITEIHYQKKMLQYIKLNAKFFSILSGIIHNSNIFFGDTDSDITLLQDNLLFIKKVAKSITDHIDKNRNEKDNYTNEGLLILLLYSIEMLNKCVLYM